MSDAASLGRRLVDAFGNPAAIESLLTEDAQWWITPTVGVLGSPSVGRDAIMTAMAASDLPSVPAARCPGECDPLLFGR